MLYFTRILQNRCSGILAKTPSFQLRPRSISTRPNSTVIGTRPEAEYKFTVQTNEGYGNAGTLNCVYVKIIGDQAKNPITDWIHLHNWFNGDFWKGKTSVHYVKTEDVGKPLILDIELRKFIFEDAWACDHIVVEYGAEKFIFPVEDFIIHKDSIARGTAYAYGQVPDDVVVNMRKKEVENNKVRFQWISKPTEGQIGYGLPRYVNEVTIDQLPSIFQWTSKRLENLVGKGFEAIINAAHDTIAIFGVHLTNLESYTKIYKHLHGGDDPVFMNCWKTDEEFGRQQLNGVSPFSISRCSEIPENCQITEDDVKSYLKSSLADEMKAGRIYLADYSKVFNGVERNRNAKEEKMYCPDAFCLYHVNVDDNLVPIAIQLVPGDINTIFTPSSGQNEWLLAKMYFKVALGNLHEWYYHFLLTHDVMETFGVAVFRCFPRSHPLYKLLRPHLQTIAFINSLARATLISPKSEAYKGLAINGDDLAMHSFKDFSFDDLVIPEVLAKKGLDDTELLPKYHYRDDALKLWKIMENFVSGIINHYYKTDMDVENDDNVQDFVNEMASEGYGWQDGNHRGIPVPLKPKTKCPSKLTYHDPDYNTKPRKDIRLCTTIAFTTSAQHAAVNFPQYEIYKYIPNSPLAMRLPPPENKDKITSEKIMEYLPDVHMSTVAVTIAYVLSSYSPNEVFIGDYPLQLFTEREVIRMEENYRDALGKYSDEIRQRNDGMANPVQKYDWLLRSKVPNSIAI